MTKILVTGAAGYIGSIVTKKLIEEGYSVIALDNLEQGHKAAVAPEAFFLNTDLSSFDLIDQVFTDNHIDAVVHLASKALVGESMSNPQKYFHTNLLGGIHLLDIMLRHNVEKLIFSSSSTIYGNQEKIPIEESQPIVPPLNTYGETKLMIERIISRYADAYGLKFVALRFFNVAGSYDKYGEDHDPETHLIPNILKVALGKNEYIEVFGNDYPTFDGTCIRDYIHVQDIAAAQILALKNMEYMSHNKIYNVGIGKGFSVLEVINAARKITGCAIPIKYRDRRPGDPPILAANANLINKELGWKPKYNNIADIVESAWEWHRIHPDGYAKIAGNGSLVNSSEVATWNIFSPNTSTER